MSKTRGYDISRKFLSPKLSTLNLPRSSALYTCKNRSLFSFSLCPSSFSFSSFRLFPFNFCFACVPATIAKDFYRGVSGDFVVRDVLRLCGEGTATWEFERNVQGIFIPVARLVCLLRVSFLGDFFSLLFLFLSSLKFEFIKERRRALFCGSMLGFRVVVAR